MIKTRLLFEWSANVHLSHLPALFLLWCVSILGPACSATTENSTQSSFQQVDLLVTEGYFVTMDQEFTEYPDGFLAVRGGRIVALGPMTESSRYRGVKTIDADHGLVLPGLVNGHGHAAMTLMRGLGEDLELMGWLEKYVFPIESELLNDEYVYWGTLLAVLEMISSGTTTFTDMYYFEDEVAQATADAGMRGVLGQTIIGFPAPDHDSPAEALAFCEQYVSRWKNHPLVTPAIAPHSPYTCDEATLRASKAMADRLDVPLLIHLAETQNETKQSFEKTGKPPIPYLNSIGFLSNRVVAAHCVWADSLDIGLLKQSGVGVIHNPESNMKLASGVAPVSEMLESGVAVGLGTDGAASNNNLDLFQEMDTMAKLHKLNGGSATAFSAREALVAATLGSARALDLDRDIGSLEVGKKADLIVVRRNLPAAIPMYDPYSLVVYSLNGSSVDTVVVDGEVLMESRRFTKINVPEVYAQASRFIEEIRAVLGRREGSD
jgi:5-methylthioadenosine/S-adenosylhomocysteine deaminase